MRSVPEWVGATPDAKIPPRVRLRVYERHGGVCALSGRKIMPGDAWDCDHKVALANGGLHAECNLQPVLRDKHREKTKADVAEKAKVAKTRSRHIGIKPAKAKIPSPPKAPKPTSKTDQLRAMRERAYEEMMKR